MKKILLVVMSVCSLCLCSCGNSVTESSTEVTAKENQKIVYGMVSEIEGNQVTYMELDESVVEKYLGTDDTDSGEEKTNEQGEEQKKTEEIESTEMEMGKPEGMSEGNVPSQMPPEMNAHTDDASQSNEGGREKSNMMPNMNGDSTTTYIPVGVTVHTSSDTKTTFSRIVAGDILEILYETDTEGNDVIVEIWMLN